MDKCAYDGCDRGELDLNEDRLVHSTGSYHRECFVKWLLSLPDKAVAIAAVEVFREHRKVRSSRHPGEVLR